MDSKSSKSRTKQLAYWRGGFGDAYIDRNSAFNLFKKRRRFFETLLNKYPDIESVCEIGCNVGWNLKLLNQIDPNLILFGVEPNKKAAQIAKKSLPLAKVFEKSVFDLRWKKRFDLVFTAGVLIHIADKDLRDAFEKIYLASKKYILAIEYYSSKNAVVPYRGMDDALIKRPFGKLWKKFDPDLELIDYGILDKTDGFDNSNWWLYKKKPYDYKS